MKSILLFGLLAFAVSSSLALARPGYGGGRVYHGYYGGHGYHYYGHPHYYAYRPYYGHYPYYYRHYPYYYGPGSYTSFGFGFGGVYAPPPVYVTPPPTVIYESPPVTEEQPAVEESPQMQGEQPEMDQPPADGAQGSPNSAAHGFVETRREYHNHGSNRGQLDWVEGIMDGRPVRIYYDNSGRVKKQKWLD